MRKFHPSRFVIWVCAMTEGVVEKSELILRECVCVRCKAAQTSGHPDIPLVIILRWLLRPANLFLSRYLLVCQTARIKKVNTHISIFYRTIIVTGVFDFFFFCCRSSRCLQCGRPATAKVGNISPTLATTRKTWRPLNWARTSRPQTRSPRTA